MKQPKLLEGDKVPHLDELIDYIKNHKTLSDKTKHELVESLERIKKLTEVRNG